MNAGADSRPSHPGEPWLEIIDASSPILLIAPHGGRAGAAARAKLHPKVNDLHTAEITRELARRLGASAMINSGMDRNQLDCNRLPEVAEQAPWMLELIAERLARILERQSRATVLFIHGWNIIEPRVDFGLGLRNLGGELRASGSAFISAADDFINGALAALAHRLTAGGIKPTFGMRYPAGGLHNLVQAFTARHRASPIGPIGKISAFASRGVVDAAQLELSVSVRMPGPLRTQCIDAIVAAFDRNGTGASNRRDPFVVNRTPRPRAAAPKLPATAPSPPSRVGIEFFDPSASIGAMASFDLGGAGATGARIMILHGRRRVALFTAEGRPAREPSQVRLGPLAFLLDRGSITLSFRGPAVIVPDSAAYVSIERALASGRLDPTVDISLKMPLAGRELDLGWVFDGKAPPPSPPAAAPEFGTLTGELTIGGVTHPIRAAARVGMSFTGLGPQGFRARRMIWASFSDGAPPSALELRTVIDDGAADYRDARLLDRHGWMTGELDALEIETPAVDEPPDRIAAGISAADGKVTPITGQVAAYVPLSRPGPNLSRIYTCLGFARFSLGEREGAGMFEYSRRIDAGGAAAPADPDDSDLD